MTDSIQPDNDSITEELTAYLDGELDSEAMQRVESRLSEDADYLAHMQDLQKTWDLLDVVPVTEPGASFTKTTMELVVGEAVKSEKHKRSRGSIWLTRIAVMIAVPAMIFASAVLLIRRSQTSEDRILIENLSVIENHPRFEAITYDLDFLVMLHDRSLFADSKAMVDDKGELIGIEPVDDVPTLVPDSPDDRRDYVKSLDVQQVVKLKRKLNDFKRLKPDSLVKLKEFDAALSANENRSQLLWTLNAYYDWLVKIDSGEKSRLRDKSAKDRIDAIVQIRNRQALEEFGRDALAKLPSPEDAEPILGWCESLFQLKEKQIRGRFPNALVEYAESKGRPAPPMEFVRRKSRAGNLHTLVDFLIRVDQPFIENLIFEDQEMSLLYDILSFEARKQLDERSAKRRRKLVLSWVESANQSKCGISLDVLKEFESRLPAQDRDRLAKMSTEDYVTTLRRMFVDRRNSNQSSSDWEQEFQDMLDAGSGQSWR